ncbi:MFS transporter [Rubrobacter taiwanensis]|jgi:MFS family permease|nr:MFS transporter [Rubrobacter taiwanensis]
MGTATSDVSFSIRRKHTPTIALLGVTGLSEFGNVLASLAIPWFVLQTSGSPLKTGITGATMILAFVIAGIFSGPLLDRLGFRRSSIASDISSGITVAMIPLLYLTIGLPLWLLLILVFVGALLDAPGRTARLSMLPELARDAQTPIERLNSAYQAILRLSQLIGPPLGGVLIAILGASNVMWLNAATFIVSALVIAIAVPARREAREEKESGEGYINQLWIGLAFIRHNKLILSVFLLYTTSEFLDAPFVTIALPVYADTVFGSAISLGLMVGGLGGGALIGSIIYGFIGHRLPRWRTCVVALVAAWLPFWVLAYTSSFGIVMVILFVMGLAAGPLNALLYTVVHEHTPPEVRGRVFGVFFALALAMVPLGMVLSGYFLEILGLRLTLVAIAVGYLAIILSLIVIPSFRRMDSSRQ